MFKFPEIIFRYFSFCLSLVAGLSVSIQAAKPLEGSLGKSKEHFLENKGQIHYSDGKPAENVCFVLDRGETKIFILRDGGIAYQTERKHYPKDFDAMWKPNMGFQNPYHLDSMMQLVQTETYRMDMKLLGANLKAEIIKAGESLDYIHYYNHNVLQVHHYERLLFKEIYPGIDWIIYTTEQGFKYDFLVKPGANPGLIKMLFSGQEELKLDRQGNLLHGNRLGRFIEEKPVSYQGNRKIQTDFILKDSIVEFGVSAYDKTQSLTIDPNRIWGTYYGGVGTDYFLGIDSDSSNFLYATGISNSQSNISHLGHQLTYGGGYQDAIVVKFDQYGNRIWATYFGGTNSDGGICIAVDSLGGFAISGFTNSLNGIAFNGFQNNYAGADDCFVSKFKSDGTLIWSTYFGGGLWDAPTKIVLDLNSHVILVGKTESQNGIGYNGFQNIHGGQTDGFIVKFDSVGNRLWSSYFGNSGNESINCITIDSENNILLGGNTTSSTGIAFNSFQNSYSGYGQDGFILKLSPIGYPLWCSYVGGNGIDEISSILTDELDHIYICGTTNSTNEIAQNGFQNNLNGGFDAFIKKYASNSFKLKGTYFGSTADERYSIINIDQEKSIFLTGATNSQNNLSFNGFQQNFGGSYDSFILKLDSAFQLKWSSYYGGTFIDYCFDHVVFGKKLFLVGMTDSHNQIAYNGHQNNYFGAFDGFIAAFNTCDSPVIEVTGPTIICTNETAYLHINSGTTFHWLLPDGTSYNGQTLALQNPTLNLNGNYSVLVTNIQGCEVVLNHSLQILPNPSLLISNFGPYCSGDSIQAFSSGAHNYSWSGPNGFAASGSSIVIPQSQPIDSGEYYVIGTDSNGCSDTTSTQILVVANPIVQINSSLEEEFCQGLSTLLQATGAQNYTWNTGQVNPSIWVQQSGTYNCIGIDSNGCSSLSNFLFFNVVPVPSWLTPPQNLVELPGQTATLVAIAANANFYQWESLISGFFQPLQDTGQYSGTQTQVLSVANLNTHNHGQQFRCIASNNLCQDTSPVAVLFLSGNQSNEKETSSSLVYPNPATTLLHLKIPLATPFNYSVKDQLGRLVLKSISQNKDFSISIEFWPTGWYTFSAGEINILFGKTN